MIRSISYSRYLKIATLMAAGKAKVAKNEMTSKANTTGLELKPNPEIPARPEP
jgi:hypothetical protein